MNPHKNIDEYLKTVPKEHLQMLKELRSLLNSLVPKGQEVIRYGMPTIQLDGKNFLHYASMKKHLGFYPTPSGVNAFEEDLMKRGIDFSKGCIRFTYDEPLPVSLITKIVKFRLKESTNNKIC